MVRGHAGTDAGRGFGADGWGGRPSPDSRVQMATEGSGPHLGSSPQAARHVPQVSAPQTPELGGSTAGLFLNQDGCVSVPTSQRITLQVDMAMALQRVKLAENYNKSYLCLLQTIFVVGRYPAARATRWPWLPTSWLACSSPLPLPPQPRSAGAHLVLPHLLCTHTRPHCGGAPSSHCYSGPHLGAGCASLPSGTRRRTVRKCGQRGEDVSAVAGSSPLSTPQSLLCVSREVGIEGSSD